MAGEGMASSRGVEHLSVNCHEKRDVLAIDPCEHLQLDEIDPPLPQFALRNERAWLPHESVDLALSHLGVLARLDEPITEGIVGPLIRLILWIHVSEV